MRVTMQKFVLRALLCLGLGGRLFVGADVVYVTDLTIFTELAPCAASAVSYAVMSMTYDACPEAVTELQSCVCSKNQNSASIRTRLSSSVSYSCGGTASDDQASATLVYDAYCNQASAASFAKPSSPVSEYITDYPAWADLAPCARSALSYNVMSMTYDLCPADASMLATCVCQKNQNSLKVSQGINTSVKYSCSSHTADLSSAQAVYAAYCGLNNGTSSFPTTSNPPGDMTYYITGLSEYASLAPCAQSAVSYGVFSQTYDNCPGGPQALASCACIKDQMPSVVSSVITSNVKYSCSSTASEDITSALAVWNLYCSAAKGLVTPAGVTESVQQTSAIETARTGSGAGASGPSATGTAGSGSGSSGGSSGSSGSAGSSGGSKSNLGTIVGAVVGVIVGLLLIAGVAFFIWRRRRAAKDWQHTPIALGDTDTHGKPELDSTAVAAVPAASPSPSTLKPNVPTRTDNVSPVSTHGTYPQYPQQSELPGQHGYSAPAPQSPQQPELPGQNGFSAPPAHYYNQSELPNHQPYSEMPSPASEAHGQQIYEAPGQNRPDMYNASHQGASWQSGPVSTHYEMDGGWTGQNQQPQR
ncbi:hypothetical protein JX265_010866 [Neoarthrinium moseri]|uniref:Uncharacterized protein n=1 Tax=Neoarthrinium moseri TaxID=1658444 RepID=A0A9Q0AK03_9PEZI|nr:hypothetical protein JX265_010866 [Neoarthrinium moseri]